MSRAKRTARTRETLLDAKRISYQRMQICIQIDVPDDHFNREDFNEKVTATANTFSEYMPGSKLILVTTEEILKS
jgi:hypothetical protein